MQTTRTMSTTQTPIVFNIVVITLIKLVSSLANCPSSCQCDDYKLIVNCGEGHLDVLPIALNPSIQRLVIQNNKIKTIDSSMQFYGDLNYLDLSSNHLFSIPPRTFAFQAKLQELHLNHNKISSISNHTFTGLQVLTTLNLRGNLLDELHNHVFSTLPKLSELNLGQNRIARINQEAFAGLQNLRILYLDDNELIVVPSDTFPPLISLVQLHLGINAISIIQSRAFESLTNLHMLNLKGAGLSNLSIDAFAGLESTIQTLDLSDNQLQRIPTEEINSLVKLEELSIGQNQFQVIAAGAFNGLGKLRRIDISGPSKLQQIQSGAFATNQNLESIMIASNKELSDIEDNALSGLPQLKHVTLRGNALTELSENIAGWKKLETFDVSDNPIHCGCQVMWLRDLLVLKNASQPEQNNVICATPSVLADEPLKLISPGQLGCSSSDVRQQAIFGMLLVGAAAMITAIALFICRCRRRFGEMVGSNWRTSNIGHKEREYQKTFSDEEYMHAVVRHPSQPCNLNAHHHTAPVSTYSHQHPYYQTGIRPIPVTEL